MKIVLTLSFLVFFSVTSADKSKYKTYSNEKFGVSFEYPSSAEIEDMSKGDKLRVWFHLGQKPVSGVLLKVESEKKFKALIEELRAEQKEYKKDITEKEYILGTSATGIEIVRDIKPPISSKIYYFIFPSIREKVILSLWHREDTAKGFMGNPKKEAEAIKEYKHLIETLKLKKK